MASSDAQQIGVDERGVDTGPRSRSGGIDSKPLPSNLDEHQKAIVETTKIREMTVEPGVMRVPVKEVTTAHNSEQWVLVLDHPVEDEIRFFLPKPRTGWSKEYKLVRVLGWYDVTNEGSSWGTADPYALQVREIYISYDDQEESWELVRPPDSRSRSERLKRRLSSALERFRSSVPSTDRTAFRMFAFVWGGALLSLIVAVGISVSVDTYTVLAGIMWGFGVQILSIVVGLAVTEP